MVNKNSNYSPHDTTVGKMRYVELAAGLALLCGGLFVANKYFAPSASQLEQSKGAVSFEKPLTFYGPHSTNHVLDIDPNIPSYDAFYTVPNNTPTTQGTNIGTVTMSLDSKLTPTQIEENFKQSTNGKFDYSFKDIHYDNQKTIQHAHKAATTYANFQNSQQKH